MLSNFTGNGFPFEWRDVFQPTEDQLRTLAIEHDLPEAAVIDCMQSEHLPKYEAFEKYHFIKAVFLSVMEAAVIKVPVRCFVIQKNIMAVNFGVGHQHAN